MFVYVCYVSSFQSSSASSGEQDESEMTDKQKADMDSFYERFKKFQDEKGKDEDELLNYHTQYKL